MCIHQREYRACKTRQKVVPSKTKDAIARRKMVHRHMARLYTKALVNGRTGVKFEIFVHMCMGVRNAMCANAHEGICESMHLPVGTHAGQTAPADLHAAVVWKTCPCQS